MPFDFNKKHTAAQVRKLIDYNPIIGSFTWKPREVKKWQDKSWNTKYAGTCAGWDKDGYTVLTIEREKYPAHRVAWLLMTGEWPEKLIDHKDNNPSNNAWENLRQVDHSQNLSAHNVGLSGKGEWPRGVRRRSAEAGFAASVSWRGKTYHCGTYATPEEAHDAYRIRCNELKGKFSPYFGQEIETPKPVTIANKGRKSAGHYPRNMTVIRGRFYPQINYKRKTYRLGGYATQEEAQEAIRAKARELYGKDSPYE